MSSSHYGLRNRSLIKVHLYHLVAFEAGGTDARAAADSAWSRVRSAAEAVEGGLRLESAPLWAKAERDVFGDSGGSRKILEALKNRFDPDRILNPGRFAGAI